MPRSRRYHRAHETELRRWAEAGDLLAEFERLHRETIEQMVRDLTAGPQTSFGPPDHVVPLGKNLGLRFQKAATWVVLSFLLDERTSKQAILDHWDEINAWQERLQKWQGPWSAEWRYIAHIERWHDVWGGGAKADPSYAKLAQWINHEIATNLAIFVTSLQLEPLPGAPPVLELLLEQPSWCVPSHHWAWPLYYAKWIMEVFGMSPEAIRDYCMRALGTLQEAWTAVSRPECYHTFDGWWLKLLTHVKDGAWRDNPIGADKPIDRDRIIDKLKQWRKQPPSRYPRQ